MGLGWSLYLGTHTLEILEISCAKMRVVYLAHLKGATLQSGSCFTQYMLYNAAKSTICHYILGLQCHTKISLKRAYMSREEIIRPRYFVVVILANSYAHKVCTSARLGRKVTAANQYPN